MENNVRGEAHMANENVTFESKRQVYHYEPPIPKEEAILNSILLDFGSDF